MGLTMRAHLLSVSSLDPDIDIDDYVAPDPHKGAVWLRLMVAPLGEQGEESFDILVCTPLWLSDIVAREGSRFGLHHLIVDPLDLQVALGFVTRRIESLVGDTWQDLAAQLARLAYWEFEDYRQ
jgi:hypothetical protein